MSDELIIDGKPAKVGDRVWHFEDGWGKLSSIGNHEFAKVKFDNLSFNIPVLKTRLYLQEMRLVPADAVVIRPDWENAPEGVKSWTVDGDGESTFHTVPEPNLSRVSTDCWSYDKAIVKEAAVCDEWRDSKRLRPEPEKKGPRWIWAYKHRQYNINTTTQKKFTEQEFIAIHGNDMEWYEPIDATRED